MPEIRKHIKRICFHCKYYAILLPDNGNQKSGPFCILHEKFFPNPFGWMQNDKSKKAGNRSCKRWAEK
jgi:hypothetical protein